MWVSGRVPKWRLYGGLAIGAIANILPESAVIGEEAKIGDMI